MGSLTSLIPVPRSVPCGGRVVTVAEFRIRDLATLQAALDAREPDPWEAIRAEIAASPTPGRRAELLSEAWERAERGAPQVGTPQGNAFFCTPEGASFVLWIATRRHTHGMTPALAAELFVKATAAEVGIVWRIAYGISAASAMEKHVFAPELLGEPGDARPVSWPEVIDELARANNWTYEYIYDLTVSEFGNARRKGEVREVGVRLSPGQDWGAMQEIQRRWFYGDG